MRPHRIIFAAEKGWQEILFMARNQGAQAEDNAINGPHETALVAGLRSQNRRHDRNLASRTRVHVGQVFEGRQQSLWGPSLSVSSWP